MCGMRYEWRDGNDNPVAIEGDPNESWNLRYFLDWGEGLQPVCDESISWGAELSRLAEENRALRAELSLAPAVPLEPRPLELLLRDAARERAALEAENTALADECVKLARERDDLLRRAIAGRQERGRLEAEVERYVEESGRHAKAFRLQLDRAVAAEAERDRALARIAELEADLEQARRDLAYRSEIRVRAEKRCAELATSARLADAAVKQSRDENGQLRAEVERLRGLLESAKDFSTGE